MMKLRFYAKCVSCTCHYLINAFTASHTQIYATNVLRQRMCQNCHQSPDSIIDIHRIDVIFSIACNRKVWVALEGEAAYKFCVKLTCRLIGPIGTEEANNSSAFG